jgi:hypothetical protein
MTLLSPGLDPFVATGFRRAGVLSNPARARIVSSDDVSRPGPDFGCVVAGVLGKWVRCESTDRFKTPNYETWRSLESLVQITRYPK